MKKLNTIYFVTVLAGASVLFGCNESDPITPATPEVETPDTEDNGSLPDKPAPDEHEEEPAPVTEFKMKIDGKDYAYKILKGRYFVSNKSVDIESHEIDDTFDNQIVIGLQVDFGKVNTPGTFDFETGSVFDVILYLVDHGKSYQAKKGVITLKTISTTRIEATFTSITMASGSNGIEPILLTNGSISIDLVKDESE